MWLCQSAVEETEDTGEKKYKLTNDPCACKNRVTNIIHWTMCYCMRDARMIWYGLTWRIGDVSVVVTVGSRHGLIAQALLGTSVVVIVICGLFVCSVALVPASQVFSHQSLLDVLTDMFVAPGWTVPWRPQCGVQVLCHAVYLVIIVVSLYIVAVISCLSWVVGRIDIIVSLHLIVVHVGSIGVRLWFCVAGISCDTVSCCCGSGARLVGVAAGVRLSQIRHAACVGIHVFSVAAACSRSVGVVAGDSVLHTGMACVGGTIIEDLGAVAASGCGEGERLHGGFGLR